MNLSRTRKSVWITRAFYALSFLISVLAIIGWKKSTSFLLSYITNYPKMMPNTAIALFLSSLSLFLQFEFSLSKLSIFFGKTCAFIVLLISGSVIYEYTAHKILIIDSLPLILGINVTNFYSRPSLEAAVLISFTSISLIFFKNYLKKSLISQHIGFISVLVIQFFLIGYMTKTPRVYSMVIPGHSGIALPTLIALLCLNTSFVTAYPTIGFTSLIFRHSSSGVVIRTLSLMLFFIPIILIFSNRIFQKIGHVDEGLSLSYSVTLTLLIFSLYVWRLAKTIERIDIEEKSARKKAQAAEQKYRGLLEAAGDGIVIVNKEGTIDFVNDIASKWFGYGHKEIIGQKIEILVPERMRENHVHLRDEYMKHPVARPLESSLGTIVGRRKDGSEFPVEISLNPSSSGGESIVTAIIRDITDRKNREVQKEFLNNLSVVMNQSFEYEIMLNKLSKLGLSIFSDWNVVIIEKRAQKQKHFFVHHRDSEKEDSIKNIVANIKVEGKEKSFLCKNITNEKLQSLFSLNAEQAKEITNIGIISLISIPLIAREIFMGNIILVSSHHNFTENEFELAKGMVDKVSLIIDNARLYQEAKEAIQSREDTLAIVSHDLRNPLTSINLACTSLDRLVTRNLSGEEFNTKITKSVENIKRSSQRASRLINDLLDFAKIESGTLSLDKKYESISELMQEVISIMDPIAKEKSLKLISQYTGEGVVLCDKNRLYQALVNLVGNAIKFSSNDQSIKLNAQLNDGEWLFSVEDNGLGMEQETAEHIFERYWQPEESRKQGTGLGLAIVKGIVETHGGKVWVKTERAKGSTFYFTIPNIMS